MNVGTVIARIGGVDGVALEAEKWFAVLERMGHRSVVLTGQLEGEVAGATVAPELSFFQPQCAWEQDAAFVVKDQPEDEIVRRIERSARVIAERISAWIEAERLDVVVAQNCLTIPLHVSLGVALTRVIEETGIKAVSHNHDFYWERGERYATGSPRVREILETCFPPRLPSLRHAVINSYNRDQLQRRFGVDAVVVPNVMDFDEPFAVRDEHNGDLLPELGVPEGAVALFQVTRIIERKNIEAAIELTSRLKDLPAYLVITGTATDDYRGSYLERLHELARSLGVAERVIFAGERFARSRGRAPEGRKLYSLDDAYARAGAMTYFSTYEGFGNAFVEAVLARVPVFVNSYVPVYEPDIGSKGFETVQIEGGRLDDEAVRQVRAVLGDADLRAAMVEHNFRLGREHFSYGVLQRLIERLFAD